MSEKILGYVLIVVGISAIIFSLFNVYGVFTKKINPISLFDFGAVSIDTGKVISDSFPKNVPPEAAQFSNNNLAIQETEVISEEMINSTSNIVAHIVLMGFIANIGYKLASLGVKLVRPIVVKSKQEKDTTGKTTQ